MSICDICFEQYNYIQPLRCCRNNLICKQCLQTYNKPTCPFCKQYIKFAYIATRIISKPLLTQTINSQPLYSTYKTIYENYNFRIIKVYE